MLKYFVKNITAHNFFFFQLNTNSKIIYIQKILRSNVANTLNVKSVDFNYQKQQLVFF